jgi:hypothetical protein
MTLSANATDSIPDGLLAVPLSKGCILLLTAREFTAGVRRGKWWKRRAAMLKREAKTTAPAPGQIE